jgi:acetyltransferase-like isoleucine patch superfamily enzyme
MGKALDEIGPAAAWRYGVGQLQHALLRSVLLPPQLRIPFMRIFGAEVGRDGIIHPISFSNLYRTGFRGLSIGRECFIGEECFLDLADSIELGDAVTLANRVMVMTHRNVGYSDHPLQERYPAKSAPVRIGSGAFIGSGAIILAGVSIGERAMVAAGAVVNRDVPADGAVAGVPAVRLERP